MRKSFWLSLCFLVISACSNVSTPKDVVVIDWANWLKDGESVFWKLDQGKYKLDLTASGDGVDVEWVGAGCPGAKETRNYSVICQLNQTSQLIVKNPTAFGLGASSSVTVKVVKLAN